MKIPVFVLSLAFGAILAVQGWTLTAIVDLKVTVATLSDRVNQQPKLAITKNP